MLLLLFIVKALVTIAAVVYDVDCNNIIVYARVLSKNSWAIPNKFIDRIIFYLQQNHIINMYFNLGHDFVVDRLKK